MGEAFSKLLFEINIQSLYHFWGQTKFVDLSSAFRKQEGIGGGIPFFLPWVYYIYDIFLQHIGLYFYSDLSLPPFVLYIDHVIKPSDLLQQGVYFTKGNGRTSADYNCADSLLIHQTLTAFSKRFHNFPLFCPYALGHGCHHK